MFVVLSIMFLSSALSLHQAAGQQATLLSVQPATSFGLNTGQTFSINVTVASVTDLVGWQFKLYFESAVLNYATDGSGNPNVTEGSFLQTPGTGFFAVVNFTQNYNATHGFLEIADLRFAEGGATGSGTLVTVWFNVVGSGSSVLHLGSGAKLIDSNNDLIPFTPVDGQAFVGVVDVAIGEIEDRKSVV